MESYFKPSEFECKCGCGLNNVNSHLIESLNLARKIAGVPFVITSGSRFQAHNKKVGGLASSSHLSGFAVDIKADSSALRHDIIHGLTIAGFKRIGIHKHFIHADNDFTKPQRVTWIYK